MSLDYIYINERIASKLNEELNIPVAFSNCSSINDVVTDIIRYLGNDGYSVLSKLFNVPNSFPATLKNYIDYIISVVK